MRTNVKIQHLQAFRAVMETESISHAADRLNLTQPAISKHLMGLERELGMRLFDRRRGGPVTPTREGVSFYRETQNILLGIDKLQAIASEIKSHNRQRLRIAATPPVINSRAITNALRAFRAAHPDVLLSLAPHHRLEIEDTLLRGEVDFALALLPIRDPSLTAMPICHVKAVCVVSVDHEFADRKEITFDDLKGQTLILPDRQPIRTQIDYAQLQQNVALKVDIEGTSAITCCRYAVAGLGVTICDPFSPTAFAEKELRVLNWSPELRLVYGALLRPGLKLGTVAQALLDLIATALNDEAARLGAVATPAS